MILSDNETKIDLLNNEAIANTIVTLLRERPDRPVTVGVHGDWGAGKSSVLEMIAAAFDTQERTLCLKFNGWRFQGFEDAKIALIEGIVTSLVEKRSLLTKAGEAVKDIFHRIDLLKAAKKAGGLALTAYASAHGLGAHALGIHAILGTLEGWSADPTKITKQNVDSLLSGTEDILRASSETKNVPEEIAGFRKAFDNLLDKAEIEQLVILIDDLDRCLPDTAIETLEAVRLFVFAPRTAFVVAADEAMIEYAVRQHFPNLPLVSGPAPYARNYLEKLIQVPFRIPALGTQEVRTYVTLLLIEALVGDDHSGFKILLATARKTLNQPWLGSGLSQGDVRAVDPTRQRDLDAAFLLAQQIGPILAEGAKGNPRQIKRFLNSLFIRLTIAKARGFGPSVNEAVLAKLMLAERFQQDFYEHLATQAMLIDDGKVSDLRDLEVAVRQEGNAKPPAGTKEARTEKPAIQPDATTEKWLERDWLRRWLRLEPALGMVDLRPYVFIARDKRILVTAGESTGLESLIETLTGSEMAVRAAEPQVKALIAADAERVFAALRERVVRHGTFTTPPPGFEGLTIVAKHHPRYQTDILGLLSSIDARALGIWVVPGWNEILTEPSAKAQLEALMKQWASQDDNNPLKNAASRALATPRRVTG